MNNAGYEGLPNTGRAAFSAEASAKEAEMMAGMALAWEGPGL